MISSALEICEEISRYGKELITFISIRGSVVEGTVTYEDDIDILINSKKGSKILRVTEKVKKRYEYLLKKKCPELKRPSVISIYLPRTPRDPYLRHEFFIKNPVELEMRTTHAEQPLPRKLEGNVYKFHRNYLRRVVKVALENPYADSFKITENMRRVAMEKYKLDRDTAHNSTMISQARLTGLIFSRDCIRQNNIVLKRNKLLEEKFKEKISEINYWMGV